MSPLGARAGSTLAWTGTELLVWAGGSNHQGAVPAFADGAAFNPATGQWRTLPVAPMSARISGGERVDGHRDAGVGRLEDERLHRAAGRGGRRRTTRRQTSGARCPTRHCARCIRRPRSGPGSEMVVLGGGDDGRRSRSRPTTRHRTRGGACRPAAERGNGAYAVFADGRAIFGVTADGVLSAFVSAGLMHAPTGGRGRSRLPASSRSHQMMLVGLTAPHFTSDVIRWIAEASRSPSSLGGRGRSCARRRTARRTRARRHARRGPRRRGQDRTDARRAVRGAARRRPRW